MDELQIETDTNDYQDLFSKLRNSMTTSRDGYKTSLAQVKDAIEQKKEELRILEIRKNKLEGAIEATDISLVAVLPNNNKR